MEIISSEKKVQLLRFVQHRGFSININEIVKLIEKYENLQVEDFAPPVLPYELYLRLKEKFADSQEKELCRKLDRPQETWLPSVRAFADVRQAAYSPADTHTVIPCASAMPTMPPIGDDISVFLYTGGQQYGPYNRNVCKQLIDNGQLTKQTLVWMKGMAAWSHAEEVAELQPLFSIVPLETSSVLPPPPPILPPANPYSSLTSTKDPGKQKEQVESFAYSSIFAPAEVKRKSHMLVQVYLHLFEETEKVKALAQESQKDAERRDYIPLQCKLKTGDTVDVLLNIYGETLLMSEKKSIVWQGSFTKCSFDYFVPEDIDLDELSCVSLLTVNSVPVGEMRFVTKIVENPRKLNPEIIAHKYNKVFISYSHKDESKVNFLHEGLKLGSVPHFFDRKYLNAGDVFPQVIQEYISSADLFILCWSENASKSEYVQKERMQALERAFPQVQPEKAAKLRIYPVSIEPRTELPSDMKDNYHFGEI